MNRAHFETPEELYQVLMSIRASGEAPPYLFVFASKEQVVTFLDQCSDEDFNRFTQSDIHLLIEYEGEFFRFCGLEGRKPVFETPPETIH